MTRAKGYRLKKGLKIVPPGPSLNEMLAKTIKEAEQPQQGHSHANDDALCGTHRCPACAKRLERDRMSYNVGGRVFTQTELDAVTKEWLDRGIIQ